MPPKHIHACAGWRSTLRAANHALQDHLCWYCQHFSLVPLSTPVSLAKYPTRTCVRPFASPFYFLFSTPIKRSRGRWISFSFGLTQMVAGFLMAIAVTFTLWVERSASLKACFQTSNRVKFRECRTSELPVHCCAACPSLVLSLIDNHRPECTS